MVKETIYSFDDSQATILRKANRNLKKRKKYQLKYNNGTELELVFQTDAFIYMMNYLSMIPTPTIPCYSVWMDGKVLE